MRKLNIYIIFFWKTNYDKIIFLSAALLCQTTLLYIPIKTSCPNINNLYCTYCEHGRSCVQIILQNKCKHTAGNTRTPMILIDYIASLVLGTSVFRRIIWTMMTNHTTFMYHFNYHSVDMNSSIWERFHHFCSISLNYTHAAILELILHVWQINRA